MGVEDERDSTDARSPHGDVDETPLVTLLGHVETQHLLLANHVVSHDDGATGLRERIAGFRFFCQEKPPLLTHRKNEKKGGQNERTPFRLTRLPSRVCEPGLRRLSFCVGVLITRVPFIEDVVLWCRCVWWPLLREVLWRSKFLWILSSSSWFFEFGAFINKKVAGSSRSTRRSEGGNR